MIYTLGKKEIYEPYIAADPNAAKAAGGSVWRTYEEIIAYLDETRHKQDITQYCIYGVIANWSTDTKKLKNTNYRALKRDAKLIKL